MKVYTYSQARQKLSDVLNDAQRDGEVEIKRRDGQTFILKPVKEKKSPLDIPGVDTGISTNEINEAVRESRERP
ncbi:MAG TPA: prevent-host-death protein [Balneolaceae bacterium]|nr:prevent-host-death protein [Balneola sp.]HBQ59956.1 prevent-host-death protein [Balneolaceae bacterium]|tara:strand:+ start:537 stop:758 length:222 start_codon:yes stop_codon:yes gene_type:complete